MNFSEKQNQDAAHALLDAVCNGESIPQADIDAALVLTGDLPANAPADDAGFWGWLMAGVWA